MGQFSASVHKPSTASPNSPTSLLRTDKTTTILLPVTYLPQALAQKAPPMSLLDPRLDNRRASSTRLLLLAGDAKQAMGAPMTDGCFSAFSRLRNALERAALFFSASDLTEANLALVNARMDAQHLVRQYQQHHMRRALEVIEAIGFRSCGWEE